MSFLLASRYCDKLSNLAWSLFGPVQGGWQRAQAICNYAHKRIELASTMPGRPNRFSVWRQPESAFASMKKAFGDIPKITSLLQKLASQYQNLNEISSCVNSVKLGE